MKSSIKTFLITLDDSRLCEELTIVDVLRGIKNLDPSSSLCIIIKDFDGKLITANAVEFLGSEFEHLRRLINRELDLGRKNVNHIVIGEFNMTIFLTR